ncbi:fumarylacetoacetate hydrolase family protein [Fertoebacter nigrum]|uniref:Fumarylacetoacetate hydrolase family protein n=1 Tax=Fertoeibacter niger TaxID=2656921 RepID=A0A8X8GY82_9RHOB|nr:fumarylacetoacetate hydrolase family protein [Fertoeibacter niger]NUB46479.1 fumarylacetoacetate hydrolase family protein [Fertoeibacter niger]
MRFLSYEVDGTVGLAIEKSGQFLGLLSCHAGFPGTLDEIIMQGTLQIAADALANGSPVDPATVAFRPPLTRPGKVLCVGLNYADHVSESKMETPSFPTIFARFPGGFVAHGAPLICPAVSTQFDYEGELVAVIGKAGREIAEADALDHVCGYSVFNDGSVRDFQLRTTQWTVGKNFDGTGGFGPYFVTSDELPEGATGLGIQTRLNGAVVQDANTDDMIFSVRKLVSLLSIGMRLEPGDIIVTGTPSGVGAARKPQLFMAPGDVCEVSIDKIGTLRNPVVAQ